MLAMSSCELGRHDGAMPLARTGRPTTCRSTQGDAGCPDFMDPVLAPPAPGQLHLGAKTGFLLSASHSHGCAAPRLK
eukprot:1788085-Alexandrium_andersonii.AAC.1